MKRFTPWAAAAALSLSMVAVVTNNAAADEVVFKNGDRITGKVTSADAGKIVITSPVAGTVTAKMEDVKTFTTDEPITIKLKDGSEVRTPVTSAGEGAVATNDGGQVRTVALADIDKVNPPPVKWTGSLLLGAIVTRGNTDTDNVNFNANAVRRDIDDRTTLSAGYFFGRSKENAPGATSETTTDNWNALAKHDHFFTKKFYGYGIMKAEKDNIANLNLRLSPGVGVGYQWIESADMNFNTEAGLSVIHEENTVENIPAGTGTHIDTNDYLAARLAYHFDKKLNEFVTFFHNLEFLPNLGDQEDFNVNADAGIRVPLYKQLFAEFKAEWKYDATPAPDSYKNDFRYIASIGLNF